MDAVPHRPCLGNSMFLSLLISEHSLLRADFPVTSHGNMMELNMLHEAVELAGPRH